MANVIPFKKPRNKRINGHAKDCYAEAVKAAGKLKAVTVVALGIDGTFAVRSAWDEALIGSFDVYSRVSQLAEHECRKHIEGAD